MDGYCYRCGVFALLSLVTYWCRACTDIWNQQPRRGHV
jgi:hypothetical protein